MNARNLLYIKPFNRRKATKLADNKLKTKLLLESRDIGVPKLIATIHSASELESFNWEGIRQSFVIKPNRGFGGEGIMVVKRMKSGKLQDIAGNEVSPERLESQVRYILDGRFSLANIPDIAIIEEKIIPPQSMKEYSSVGLPDVRIIVFNLVPIIAMLRLPTKESGGKANIHQGAIMVGLDLDSGTGTYAYYRGKFIDLLPENNTPIHNITIPNWDRILLMASRAQRISNVGYLAIDFSFNRKESPLVMEMNARGGLGIQLANRAPLRNRLERVEGLRVRSPEHGVRLAKELFGSHIEKEIERVSGKEVIGRVESVSLNLPGGKRDALLAQIDPTKVRSSIDIQTAIDLGILKKTQLEGETAKKTIRLKIRLGGKDYKPDISLKDLSESNYKLVIGSRDLVDFLVDPLKKATEPEVYEPLPEKTALGPIWPLQRQSIKYIDHHLGDIAKTIGLVYHLRPLNLQAERERFLADPSVNPKFVYAPPSIDIVSTGRELRKLSADDSAIGEILNSKRDELLQRLAFLRAIGTPAFTENSHRLFPIGTEEDIQAGMSLEIIPPKAKKSSVLIKGDEIMEEVKKFLIDSGLEWQVKRTRKQSSDFAVSKHNTLFIRKGIKVSAKRLRGTLAHEIETHAFTAENGHYQPYEVFNYGFANFLITQEGLADTIKLMTVNDNEDTTEWAVVKYQAAVEAQKHDFATVAEKARAKGLSLVQSFNTALRVKRGLADTSKPGGFTKDAAYWLGRRWIDKWLADGGDLLDLFIGKINLEQLELAKKVPDIRPPVLLPEVLRHQFKDQDNDKQTVI